jgi:MYXO-CTERM domain-containing protein
MKKFAALALVAAAGIANAGTLDIFGDTTGGPTFNRPFAGNPPTGLSAVGTAVAYQVWEIEADAAGSYSFDIIAAGANYDTFMHLYGPGGFNPANALTNVIIGDDDSGTGSNSLFSTNLAASTSYFVVVSGFDNADFGTYTLRISGPGNISIVPTPGALALLGLGGLAASRRRR